MLPPRIAGLLAPVLERLDLELEAVDVVPAGKRRLLRIVVDGDGDNGRGPTLDDIAEATKAISDALDAADVTGASPYTLEVSSRGVGRALELPRHWRRNATRLVTLTTATGDQLTGRIVSATDESVLLAADGGQQELSYAEVTKAHVQVELNRSLAEPEAAEEEED
ncbi:MAG TPA: ribosome maturation factor RimP [Propionibacteriaceae bacterium]|nr:ribosome maturation factor RimP [Propionibacteriaceae bacterium]